MNQLDSIIAAMNDIPAATEKIVLYYLRKAFAAYNPPLQGIQFGMCVSTDDPLCQNRIRFWHPDLAARKDHDKSCDWAFPISALPGFDDSGATWVPPAGSTVALMFHNGHPSAAYYIGTIWPRNRHDPITWPKIPAEYQEIWEADRKTGYLNGGDSQVLPPFNTTNYNSFDPTDGKSFDPDKNAKVPSIFAIKTPGRAYLMFEDGNPYCNLRWKRTELKSSRGILFTMKDDHLHPAAQWCNPAYGGSGFAGASCSTVDEDGNHIADEKPECCDCGDIGCPGGPTCPSDPADGQKFANPYSKRTDENTPYAGPGTPLNPTPDLPQSGAWLQSLAGHHFGMDDSVEKPTGIPSFDLPFTTGCTDKLVGRTLWGSGTGHSIYMVDHEEKTNQRSDRNGIFVDSAAGNFIYLNDHTIENNIAGEKRGVYVGSTAGHLLHFCDDGNQLETEDRTRQRDPGTGQAPIGPGVEPMADKAYVLLRSGYGLQLLFKDDKNQESTQQQTIQIVAPDKDDQQGSHFLQMQLGESPIPSNANPQQPNAPGAAGGSTGYPGSAVLLRSGGAMILSSREINVEIVGDDGGPQAHKVLYILNGMNVDYCKENWHLDINEGLFVKSKKYILLGAGEDCPIPDQGSDKTNNSTGSKITIPAPPSMPGQTSGQKEKGPCFYPIILAMDPVACPLTGFWHFGYGKMMDADPLHNSMSNRVFASSGPT